MKLQRLLICLTCCAVAALQAAQPSATTEAPAGRPNIVLILSDDQAWGDYGFMGHADVQTPHLDRLADSGLRFDHGYVAAPICRPSLASMATGQYSFVHGVTGNDIVSKVYDDARKELEKPLQAKFHQLPSVIKLLTSNGYLAHQSGKWWEGSWQDGGFTHGMTEGERHGDKGLVIGREGLDPISEFIDEAVAGEKPFMLWYAPFLPHTPHNPPQALLEKYQSQGHALDVAKYYAMIEWFDQTCGELFETIESKGLSDNTVYLYICDNGWGAASTTLDWPRDQAFWEYAMRSKASPYENGTRTPILVSWPGVIEPQRMDGFAHSIDLFPTIAALAGLQAPDGLPGINLLDTAAVAARDTVFGSLHASHNMSLSDPDSTLQYLWCIQGDWKLLLRCHGKDTTNYGKLHEWDTAPFHLYNLKEDPGEKNDLAVAHPEIVARLTAEIAAWRAEMGAPPLSASKLND
ncbi:sulfatase-like hydrolase/transferase [Opitutales bacterium]|nr:sulfatase-like hydrolase/transferase [Opitutales bacterium]